MKRLEKVSWEYWWWRGRKQSLGRKQSRARSNLSPTDTEVFQLFVNWYNLTGMHGLTLSTGIQTVWFHLYEVHKHAQIKEILFRNANRRVWDNKEKYKEKIQKYPWNGYPWKGKVWMRWRAVPLFKVRNSILFLKLTDEYMSVVLIFISLPTVYKCSLVSSSYFIKIILKEVHKEKFNKKLLSSCCGSRHIFSSCLTKMINSTVFGGALKPT